MHFILLENILLFMVLGHNMGGALAVHAALEDQISGLIGLVVVDVVEGTFI